MALAEAAGLSGLPLPAEEQQRRLAELRDATASRDHAKVARMAGQAAVEEWMRSGDGETCAQLFNVGAHEASQIGDLERVALYSAGSGHCSLAINKADDALVVLEKALEFADEAGDAAAVLRISKMLADAYERCKSPRLSARDDALECAVATAASTGDRVLQQHVARWLRPGASTTGPDDAAVESAVASLGGATLGLLWCVGNASFAEEAPDSHDAYAVANDPRLRLRRFFRAEVIAAREERARILEGEALGKLAQVEFQIGTSKLSGASSAGGGGGGGAAASDANLRSAVVSVVTASDTFEEQEQVLKGFKDFVGQAIALNNAAAAHLVADAPDRAVEHFTHCVTYILEAASSVPLEGTQTSADVHDGVTEEKEADGEGGGSATALSNGKRADSAAAKAAASHSSMVPLALILLRALGGLVQANIDLASRLEAPDAKSSSAAGHWLAALGAIDAAARVKACFPDVGGFGTDREGSATRNFGLYAGLHYAWRVEPAMWSSHSMTEAADSDADSDAGVGTSDDGRFDGIRDGEAVVTVVFGPCWRQRVGWVIGRTLDTRSAVRTEVRRFFLAGDPDADEAAWASDQLTQLYRSVDSLADLCSSGDARAYSSTAAAARAGDELPSPLPVLKDMYDRWLAPALAVLPEVGVASEQLRIVVVGADWQAGVPWAAVAQHHAEVWSRTLSLAVSDTVSGGVLAASSPPARPARRAALLLGAARGKRARRMRFAAQELDSVDTLLRANAAGKGAGDPELRRAQGADDIAKTLPLAADVMHIAMPCVGSAGDGVLAFEDSPAALEAAVSPDDILDAVALGGTVGGRARVGTRSAVDNDRTAVILHPVPEVAERSYKSDPRTTMALPLALRRGGAGTVVAPLWNVNDGAMSLLLLRAHWEMLDSAVLNPDDADVPDALECVRWGEAVTQAQQWLSRVTVANISKFLGQVEDYCDDMGDQEASLFELLAWIAEVKARGRLSADATPFADPRYWACLVVVGSG